jgi:hypothetical protein
VEARREGGSLNLRLDSENIAKNAIIPLRSFPKGTMHSDNLVVFSCKIVDEMDKLIMLKLWVA